MSLELPSSVPDLFAKTMSAAPQVPKSTTTPGTQSAQPQAAVSLGGVMSRVLRDDQAIRKQMTAAEQAAVDALLKNVGTPDEYDSYMVYVLRALPYVKTAYGALDVTQPLLPPDDEIAILMRERYLHL
jgi:hypothetical protein